MHMLREAGGLNDRRSLVDREMSWSIMKAKEKDSSVSSKFVKAFKAKQSWDKVDVELF